jgi:hypothetical protein
MSTERRDPSDLHEPTGPGSGAGHGATAHSPGLAEFDREIDVRGIVWTGVVLVALALLAHLLMWWMLRGFSSFDKKRDVRLTPIEEASPQQKPPEPRLQDDPNTDMRRMREEEDRLLGQAGWVNRQQGIVRLPVDVAMEEILSRGVSASNPSSPPAVVAPKGRNLNSLGRQPQAGEPSNDSKP